MKNGRRNRNGRIIIGEWGEQGDENGKDEWDKRENGGRRHCKEKNVKEIICLLYLTLN
jgi:hypothetical protein